MTRRIKLLANNQHGETPLVAKRGETVRRNDPNSHLIYYLSEHILNGLMVSLASSLF